MSRRVDPGPRPVSQNTLDEWRANGERLADRARRPWAYDRHPWRSRDGLTEAIPVTHFSALSRRHQDLVRLQWPSGPVEAHFWMIGNGEAKCVVTEVAVLPAAA
ncbi:MAG: hypothetical protein E6J20_19675 [Chloroflexi bacterium]|nr:MAG: hypothetical protein E6J20_19675 [Chloroflexota bacterium]